MTDAPASWSPFTFVADDGFSLAEYRWEAHHPKAHVVLFHGAAEHQGRYDHVAQRFNAAGLSVSGIDIRGHGRSPVGWKSFRSHRQWLDDHVQYVASVQSATDVPVFGVAHSLGGCLSLTLAGERRLDVSGLATSGAAVALVDPPGTAVRTLAGLTSRLVPGLGMPAGLAENISSDPAVVAAYRNDPLVPAKLPARVGAEIIAAVRHSRTVLSGVDLPLLAMHGSADKLADPSALGLLQSRVASKDATYRELQGWYHELFNEPGHAPLLDDVTTWILDRADS